MNDKPKPARSSLGEAAQARADNREARRAAALRANLARRKAQSRTRGAGESGNVKDVADDPET